MSRRIDVELTSSREDGSWTWRAAGARQPKGVLDGTLLPAHSAVGDVLRADVETDIDGTTVVAVLPPKEKKVDPDRLEIITSGTRDDQLVTTTLAGKGRGGDRRERRGGDRRDRGDRGDRRDDRGRNERGPRRGRDDHPRGDRESRPGDRREGRPSRPRREPPPEVPARPKAKRLRAGRAHRKAAIEALAPEEAVIAEQVLRGGVPAVRQAVDKQNEQARAQGHPEVKADPLVAIAERLLPRLRTAEWHDRAEAALASVDEVDLRDLRSVVVAAETAAKSDETRDLANQLREALARRVDEEQSAWLDELKANLDAGRVVRSLRLSSRPPKAGAPLPAEVAVRLVEAANASLTGDTGPDRWSTVLDALSFSPVRQQVKPESLPEKPSDDLLGAVTRVSDRLPQIAALFGIEPKPASRRPRGGAGGTRNRGGAKPKPKPKAKPRGDRSATASPAAPEAEASSSDTSEEQVPEAEASSSDASEEQAPAAEASSASPSEEQAPTAEASSSDASEEQGSESEVPAPSAEGGEQPPAEVTEDAVAAAGEAATSPPPAPGDVAGTITPNQPAGAAGEPAVDQPPAEPSTVDANGLAHETGPGPAGADEADDGDRPS